MSSNEIEFELLILSLKGKACWKNTREYKEGEEIRESMNFRVVCEFVSLKSDTLSCLQSWTLEVLSFQNWILTMTSNIFRFVADTVLFCFYSLPSKKLEYTCSICYQLNAHFIWHRILILLFDIACSLFLFLSNNFVFTSCHDAKVMNYQRKIKLNFTQFTVLSSHSSLIICNRIFLLFHENQVKE
jgi:hypothetical protein